MAACASPDADEPQGPPAYRCTADGAAPSSDAGEAPPAPAPGPPLSRIAPVFDAASTATTLDAWPLIVPGVHARSITSFDRGGGNDDGFAGTYSELCVDQRGEHVIFDEIGPGVLRTLWFTSAIDGDGPLGLGKVRFYFDGEADARLVVDADALFAGATPPFVAGVVAGNQKSSGGFASWAPLPFRERLRVTTERKAGFYQIHHDIVPPDWDVASFTPGSSDTELASRFAASAAPSTLPLEEVPLELTRAGAGTIDVLRFLPDAAPTDAELAAARITVTFDGAAAPQVDVPLGFFFGSGLGVASVSSVAWTMQPLLFESRMPMPFWDGVHVRVTGLAGKLFVHVGPERWSRAEAGTLEVRYHEEKPTTSGRDFVYADVEGTGKIVATVLGVDPKAAGNKQWWEGDLRSAIDGVRTVAIHGTGHEDDHLGGWSNEFLSRPFSLPMQGCPRTDLLDTGAEFQKNGASTMYRLWPGIPFYRSIRHSTEHGAGNGRSVDYAAATFLYRQPKARMIPSDAFDVADASSAAAHAYEAPDKKETSLTSAFEGAGAGALTSVVHEVTAPMHFSLAIAPDNDGVELRRLFDRAEVPSEAVLEVDGVRITTVATWGPYSESRRWTERDVFVPRQLTNGKSRLDIRWIPSGRFTAARFEAWSIVR
jgi:hypothetical protein